MSSSHSEYSSDDDHGQPKTPMKRRRRKLRQTRAALQDNKAGYHNGFKRRRSGHNSLPQLDSGSKKASISAELANRADYKKPPVMRSRKDSVSRPAENDVPRASHHGVNTARASRSTRQVTGLRDGFPAQGARVAKSTTTAARRKKKTFEGKVRAEAGTLGRWPGWMSEEEDMSEGEVEEQHFPRSHTRRYPRKVPGTQNIPWMKLSGEIRNSIYRYAVANEETKVLNVRHYPGGVPRRSICGIASPTNFVHSYWGFTQTCCQTRKEFTPWPLERRQVRTPLETVNDYVNTFHRPNENGQRTGWVEPICCGAPLLQHGVEVLELLKLQETSPRFHLQLVPTTVSAVIDVRNTPDKWGDFNELKIIHDMAETFGDWWNGTVVSSARLNSIHMTSVARNEKTIANTTEDVHYSQHEILIKLSVDPSKADDMSHETCLRDLNAFVFASQLYDKTGVKLEAYLDTGVAIWKIRRFGVVDMRWKANAGHDKFFRLTQDVEYPNYLEEDLA